MSKREELAKFFEDDLWEFAQYINPTYYYGDVHREVYRELADPNRSHNLLQLMSRDHLKSHMAETYALWRVTRDPAYSILYLTADEDLGKLQIYAIKQQIQSPEYQALWPDHFDPDGKGEVWSAFAINSTHPRRLAARRRDETICVKTIKSGKTGRHPDEIVFDDLVVKENAYTQLGRQEVAVNVSQVASLAKADGYMTGVGTVYHPDDQYAKWKEAELELFDEIGNLVGKEPLWDIRVRIVESSLNQEGTGNFVWPRGHNPKDEKWYGWDISTLARKRGEYFSNGEREQYFAQYYMEANDPGSHRATKDDFHRFNPDRLKNIGGEWFFMNKRLKLFHGMDTASTDMTSKNAGRSDWTASVVIGIDEDGRIIGCDLDQFKTDKRDIYFQKVKSQFVSWGFRQANVEADGGGKHVATGLRESARMDGLNMIVKDHVQPRDVSKLERHESVVVPRAVNGDIYFPAGGWWDELMNQIILPRPRHDDCLDAFTIAIENSRRPVKEYIEEDDNIIMLNSRFGGRRT